MRGSELKLHCILLHFKFILMFSLEFFELQEEKKPHTETSAVFDRHFKVCQVLSVP